jgi:hypothetical protein
MTTEGMSRFRWARRFAGLLFVVFLALQFARPRLANPPVTADLQVPADVKQILKISCYNCHSNETKLVWFDEPIPAYWLVVGDVRGARARLNFSEIGMLPPAQQQGDLYEAVSQIELGAMPLPAYRLAHPESAITPEKLQVLKNYLGSLSARKDATLKDTAAADAEYQGWLAHDGSVPSVSPAANGIAFLPDYRNWKAISSTERSDNQTLRVILGNDAAVAAIAGNHIHPWPNGTAFAKVAWYEQPDEKGGVRAGKFFQVEFMIRDSQKYASTKGWGWARWRGVDLKPYGKDAHFARECVGCHNPLAKTNYVFTAPIRGQQ